jgi:hypothetical protein
VRPTGATRDRANACAWRALTRIAPSSSSAPSSRLTEWDAHDIAALIGIDRARVSDTRAGKARAFLETLTR